MPSIDVTDVLTDPDFIDTATVTKTLRTVGTDGRAVDTSSLPVSFSAVVIPVAQRLILQSDGALRDGAIDIFTTYALSGGVKTSDSAGRQPDVVTWHGRGYTVAAVEDWTAYGAGWVRATANLQNINPTA